MTREELDSATDEQLNEMAAKMIYGITPRWVRGLGTTETVLIHNDNPFFVDGMCTVDELRKHAMPKSPATDIADAWELVLRLRKVQMRVMIVLDGDRTICDVTAPSGRDSRSACHASDTRAITTAALLAWEAKENSK